MTLTGTAKKDYDARRYRMRKAAQSGGDEQRKLMSFRLKPSILGWIRRVQAEAINSGKYPWQGTSELFEALLQRGLMSLNDDPLLDEIRPLIQLQQQFDGLHAIRRQAQVALARTSTEIAALLGIGQKLTAAQFFHSTRRTMLQMAPTVWRAWLVAEMDKAFPELLKMKVKGVQLTAHDGDGDDDGRPRPRKRK